VSKEKEITENIDVVDVPEEKPATKKKAAPKAAKAEETTEVKKPAAKKTAAKPKEEKPAVKAKKEVAKPLEEAKEEVVKKPATKTKKAAEEKPVAEVKDEVTVEVPLEPKVEAPVETKTETVVEVKEEKPVETVAETKKEADAETKAVETKPAGGNDFNRGRRQRNDQRGDGRRDNRRRNNDRDKEKEFEERVVSINRVTKVVKGGRRFRFSALVVVGDKKGRVGIGTGKANEVPDAIKKAIENAKKALFRVPLVGTTLPHTVTGVYGAGRVFLKPASEGTGVIAGGPVRAVLELAGYNDVLSKCIGSRTPINMVRATVQGLKSLRTLNMVAKTRDMKPEDVRK